MFQIFYCWRTDWLALLHWICTTTSDIQVYACSLQQYCSYIQAPLISVYFLLQLAPLTKAKDLIRYHYVQQYSVQHVAVSQSLAFQIIRWKNPSPGSSTKSVHVQLSTSCAMRDIIRLRPRGFNQAYQSASILLKRCTRRLRPRAASAPGYACSQGRREQNANRTERSTILLYVDANWRIANINRCKLATCK